MPGRLSVVFDFLTPLFDSAGFSGPGLGPSWSPELVWLHNAADGLIFLAALAIPIVLVHFIRQRRDLEREIAERKRAEVALQLSHQELEVHVRQRTEELAR